MTPADKAAAVIDILDPRCLCQKCGELANLRRSQVINITHHQERDEFYECICGQGWWQTYNNVTDELLIDSRSESDARWNAARRAERERLRRGHYNR